MTDLEQLKAEAEQILDDPDLWRLHGFASEIIELVAEVETLRARLDTE